MSPVNVEFWLQSLTDKMMLVFFVQMSRVQQASSSLGLKLFHLNGAWLDHPHIQQFFLLKSWYLWMKLNLSNLNKLQDRANRRNRILDKTETS